MSTLKVSTLRNEADSSDVAINRTTTDGTIVDLQKDGTTVGSIGTNTSDTYPYFASSTFGVRLRNSTTTITPSTSTGTNNDNAVDLGYSSSRFKNLYLSGGVYVGGTGSANYLDDYETGTWTPTYYREGDTPTSSGLVGMYMRIGNKVIISGALTGLDITSSGYLRISNFPFTPTSTNNARGTGTGVARYTQSGMGAYSLYIENSVGYVWYSATDAGNYVSSYVDAGTQIFFHAMYHTEA